MHAQHRPGRLKLFVFPSLGQNTGRALPQHFGYPVYMIRRIQALNYRCLRYADVRLDRFHVLVGPNACGKSTLFDVVAFLGDLVRDDLDAAIEKRTRNFQDLVWGRPKQNIKFELAVEFEIPEFVKDRLPSEKHFRVFRYEVAIGEIDGQFCIDSERGLLMSETETAAPRQTTLFPDPPRARKTILVGGGRPGSRTILSKSGKGTDNFNVEVSPKSGKGWTTSIAFGPFRSTLRNLPESPDSFPMATHVKRMLNAGTHFLFLDSLKMRQPSPPGLGRQSFSSDGSNLPWMVKRLQDEHEGAYREWLAHVQTVLSDLNTVRVVEREDDRSVYLMLGYKTGVEIPSWMASDGTLRFLVITLIAYLPHGGQLYLLEEPENGVHPLAVDAIYDSLSSAYESQVLVATHSPAFLKLSNPDEVLCVAKNDEGATDVIRGNDHPILRDWQGSVDMDTLFATGVIG